MSRNTQIDVRYDSTNNRNIIAVCNGAASSTGTNKFENNNVVAMDDVFVSYIDDIELGMLIADKDWVDIFVDETGN